MINYQYFRDKFELIELNFNFKYNAKLMVILFEKIKHLPQEQFDSGFSEVMTMGAEDWNKKCGFGGSLKLGDWVGIFTGQKEQSPEKQAIIQVAKILDYAKWYSGNDALFDNEFTNETVQKSGGLPKIAWEINPENHSQRPREWVTKDLKDMWLACFDGKHGSHQICKGISQPDIFYNGEFVKRPNKLDYVGDKEVCLRLENKTKTKGVNLPSQRNIAGIVGDITKKFKNA